jgi:ABC-type glycerol-3-phosphate transport system substrate-binding protein
MGPSFNTEIQRVESRLRQAGGALMNEDYTKPMFNSKEGVEALNFFNQLLNVDKTAYISTGHEAQNHFLAENVAFYEGSSVSYVYLRTAEITFNLGIAAVPHFRTERNIISGTNIAIFDKGDDKKAKAAWEFMKWLTETKQTAKFSSLSYYMPVRRSAFEHPYIQEMLREHPGLADVYRQLEFAEFEPQIPAWFEFRKNFEEIVLERVFLQTITPEEALRQAEQRLLRELDNEK